MEIEYDDFYEEIKKIEEEIKSKNNYLKTIYK